MAKILDFPPKDASHKINSLRTTTQNIMNFLNERHEDNKIIILFSCAKLNKNPEKKRIRSHSIEQQQMRNKYFKYKQKYLQLKKYFIKN